MYLIHCVEPLSFKRHYILLLSLGSGWLDPFIANKTHLYCSAIVKIMGTSCKGQTFLDLDLTKDSGALKLNGLFSPPGV